MGGRSYKKNHKKKDSSYRKEAPKDSHRRANRRRWEQQQYKAFVAFAGHVSSQNDWRQSDATLARKAAVAVSAVMRVSFFDFFSEVQAVSIVAQIRRTLGRPAPDPVPGFFAQLALVIAGLLQWWRGEEEQQKHQQGEEEEQYQQEEEHEHTQEQQPDTQQEKTDPFADLGLPAGGVGATHASIKKAFRAGALLVHPDKNAHDVEAATAKMKVLVAARELCDKIIARREKGLGDYDTTRDEGKKKSDDEEDYTSDYTSMYSETEYSSWCRTGKGARQWRKQWRKEQPARAERLGKVFRKRKARENAHHRAREDAHRKAQEDAQRKARENAQHRARKDAQRKAREDTQLKDTKQRSQAQEEEDPSVVVVVLVFACLVLYYIL
jgi:curved DNA-binding protein CbpA